MGECLILLIAEAEDGDGSTSMSSRDLSEEGLFRLGITTPAMIILRPAGRSRVVAEKVSKLVLVVV